MELSWIAALAEAMVDGGFLQERLEWARFNTGEDAYYVFYR